MGAIPKASETTLPPLPAGWQLVTVAVLRDGTLALLATDVDLAHEWRRAPDGTVLGKPLDLAARARAKVWRFDGERLVDEPTFPMEMPFLKIDRFEDGRWLVVGGLGNPNTRILASGGHLLARIMLGDGIEHVGVDRHDGIWVGWFDQGIFGNEAWRVPGEAWAPSSRGISRFSAEGMHRSPADFPEAAGIIADCYALNVEGDGAWACPYVDFPLLHVTPGAPARWWSSPVGGARAIAVCDRQVLLAGGYGEKADRLVLMALDGDGNGEVAPILATGRIPLVRRQPRPGEAAHVIEHHPWDYPTLLAGRGDTIHLVQDGTWYRWRVSDAVDH